MGKDGTTATATTEQAEIQGDSLMPAMPAQPATPEAPAPAAPAAEAKKPIFKGISKEFHTPEELAVYAEELERKNIENEEKLQTYQRPAPEPAPVQGKKKYGERLFAEPDETIEDVAQDIETRISRKLDAREKEKTFWETFYGANSDLREFDDVVRLKLQQGYATLSKMPVSKAREKLATEARGFLSKAKNYGNPSTALPSAPAVTAGASGSPAPKVPAPEVSTSNFVTQVRGLKGRQKAS